MEKPKYSILYANKFKRNRRALIKSGYDIGKLALTIDALASGEVMPPRFKDHALKGNYIGFRECHVDGAGDWLLIYKKQEDILVLVLTATGTHTELFD